MYFHFHNEETGDNFDHKLYTEQCSFIKPNNTRCKSRVCIGLPYCWLHEQNVNHLKIKQSTIPGAGKGLFCYNPNSPDDAIIFKKDTKICPYYGQIIDTEELINRYGNKTAPYGLELKKGLYDDGAIKRGIGTLINHCNNKSKCNCRFSVKQDKTDCYIVATKNIKNGSELFINYGNNYKFDENDIKTATNRKKYKI